MSENRCVCCGAVIPEGRQACKRCEVGTDNNVGSMNGLINVLRTVCEFTIRDSWSVIEAKNCMMDAGCRYCRDKNYDISVITMDDLINEIIIKEMRKHENG